MTGPPSRNAAPPVAISTSPVVPAAPPPALEGVAAKESGGRDGIAGDELHAVAGLGGASTVLSSARATLTNVIETRTAVIGETLLSEHARLRRNQRANVTEVSFSPGLRPTAARLQVAVTAPALEVQHVSA